MQDSSDDAALRRQLRESVAVFTQRNPGAARIRRIRATGLGIDAAAWAEMAAAGWLGLAVPEAVGGLGLGLGELCTVAEALGGGLAPEPLVATTLAIAVVAAAGPGALLETLCAGDARAALAWQEQENTLDPFPVATMARPVAGGMAIAGVKRFIPAAAGAGGFIVTAQAPDGLAAFWVPADSPGLRLETDRTVDGGQLGTLHLDGVIVPGVLLADAGGAVVRALDEARVAVAAELFGLMQRALAMTVDYSKQRAQFGKPIGSFQVLQHRMVDLWMQQEVTRATLADALAVFGRTDDPASRAVAASAAKSRASAAAMLVTRQAIQLHGGIGYADEHDIGLYLKRAIVLSGWLGSAALHRRRYGALTPDWDSAPQDMFQENAA